VHAASGDRRILRASDADREAVVEQLRHHGAVGRLSVDELTGRIEAALEAKTLAQLDSLLVDLPPDGPPLQHPVAPRDAGAAPFRAWRSPTVLAGATQLLVVNLLCVAAWAAGGEGNFWPAWVLLASIAMLARRASRAAARAEREQRRASRTRTPPPFLDR